MSLTTELYGTMCHELVLVDSDMNEDGDVCEEEFTLPAHYNEPEVKEFAEIRFPQSHCQHDYDCCGNWYQYSPATITAPTGPMGWVIHTVRRQNI